jgi:hypothetical protein
MLATQIEVSDGTLNIVNVGIEFFNQADISVSLDQSSNPLVEGVDYIWTSGTTLQFQDTVNTPGGLVPNGVEVIVRRDTENDAMYNIYDGGAPFSRTTLDENFKQLLFLSQEFSEGLGLDGLQNDLDMNGYHVSELGDPILDDDAANKRYVDQLDTAQQIYIDGLNTRNLRTPEAIPVLPNAATRANKLLAFDSLGQPVLTLPASGSAEDLALFLATPAGAASIGAVGQDASPTTVQAYLDGIYTDLASNDDDLGASLIQFDQHTVDQWLRGVPINIMLFGAVRGLTASAAVNDAAIQAAIDYASSLSTTGNIVDVKIPRGTFYVGGGTFKGVNKAIINPRSNVRLIGPGTLYVVDGANAAAGATGWNLIYPSADGDAAISNFEVVGVTFYLNALNNLNTTMKRNAAIGVLAGAGIKVLRCVFKQCPGWHVITIGKDIFPVAVDDAEVYKCRFSGTGSAIPGNVGITDHSTVYGMATNCVFNGNEFQNTAKCNVGSCVELHGDYSEAVGNRYSLYLNFANIGGYITNVTHVTVQGNRGNRTNMLARGYALSSFTMDDIYIVENIHSAATGQQAMIDWGTAIANYLTDRLHIHSNRLSYDGIDEGITAPMAIWIRGVKRLYCTKNTVSKSLGPAMNLGDVAAGAVYDISHNTWDKPSLSVLAGATAAVFLENFTGTFHLINYANNVTIGAKTWDFLVNGAIVCNGDLLRYVGNTVQDCPGSISVASTAVIPTFVDHVGLSPAQGTFSTDWNNLIKGSRFECTNNGEVWTKNTTGATAVLQRRFTGGIPVSGNYVQGDVGEAAAPTAAGFREVVCVTSGSPGVWKTCNGISP